MVICECKRLLTMAAHISRMLHNYVGVLFTELQKRWLIFQSCVHIIGMVINNSH